MQFSNNRHLTLLVVVTALLSVAGAQGVEVNGDYPDLRYSQLDDRQFVFTENAGQWDNRVRFCATSSTALIWITNDGVCYQFSRPVNDDPNFDKGVTTSKDLIETPLFESPTVEHLVVRASFVGANANPVMIGEELLPHKCNYFLGNDPAKWKTDVPSYKSILLEEVYPGIDIRFKLSEYGDLTHEIIAKPVADLEQIKIEYAGIEGLSANDKGEMVARTKWGDILATIASPVDRETTLTDRITVSGVREISLDDPNADTPRTSAVSAVLEYSTYLGGSGVSVTGQDLGQSIAVDATGSAYVTGYTQSTSFPTVNEYQTDQGSIDVFISKLSSDGSSLVYSTYLGGSLDDRGLAIAVDGSGSAYVTGWTQSLDFPTENPYQSDQGNIDAFLVKLAPTGSSLVFCTYLGGSGMDSGEDLYVDASGFVYVAGTTVSSDFPTLNAYQSSWQGTTWDGFITKFAGSGSTIEYSTYLGGADNEQLRGIVVDGSGAAYVAGYTSSTDYPLLNAYQPANQGGYDLFITKLANTGSSLSYSTYIGGSSDDRGWGITVDGSGAVYIVGWTESADFPTQNPYQSAFQGGTTDAIITKLSASGSSLDFSTYLGGDGDDKGHEVTLSSDGAAYVTGHTLSTDYPILDEFQSDQGDDDVFVTALSSSGNSIDFSTYLGGSGEDVGNDIALDASGGLYITGYTESTNFPTKNAYQGSFQGGLYDAFVTKFSTAPQYVCGDADGSGAVDIDDVVYLIAYIFSGGPAPDPVEAGDADCAGGVDIDDVVYLIAYIFAGGPAPCDPSGDGNPDC